MAITQSPLRYPGSKLKAMDKITAFWKAVAPYTKEYREPFLGGATIFLNLDLSSQSVWLNDKDENIAFLFKIIRDCPGDLCTRIDEAKPAIERWLEIRHSTSKDPLDIAFRTLFLNRTNYSGILAASPIGGFEQKSQYAIDCRWNAEDLARRIHACSTKLQGVDITAQDFFFVIARPSVHPVFMVVDPPYYHKGNQLYDEGMSRDDHVRLRDLLAGTKHRFLLTYDDCDEIRSLYSSVPELYVYETGWLYTTGLSSGNGRTKGKELFISNIKLSLAEESSELRKKIL